mmetsp:Transcript_43359/g.69484  ORF Transcript_43359/g.69484 Transcript_43359/m.69484 type:complete len:273 (+) Transcript_43359:84-902(+)
MQETITNEVRTLAKQIRALKKESDKIGSSVDSVHFRKQLTDQVSDISALVVDIKRSLQIEKSHGYKSHKWKKLEAQFLHQFESLNNVTAVIRDKFRRIDVSKSSTNINKSASWPTKHKICDEDDDKINLLRIKTNSYGAIQQSRAANDEEEFDDASNYKQTFYEVAANLQLVYESRGDLMSFTYDPFQGDRHSDQTISEEELVSNVPDITETPMSRDRATESVSIISGVPTLEKQTNTASARYCSRDCLMKGLLMLVILCIVAILASVLASH